MSRIRARRMLHGVFAASLGLSGIARAESARIDYRAPEGCPSETTFRAELESRTTSASSVERTPMVFVSLDASGAGGAPSIHGRVRIRLADGSEVSRDVEGATCAEVTSALAVISAVLLDGAATPPPEATPEGAAPAPVTAAPSPTPAPVAPPIEGSPAIDDANAAARPRTRRRRAVQWASGVQGTLVSGAGTSLRFGPRFVAEAVFSRSSEPAPALRVSFAWTPEQSDSTAAGVATLSWMAGRIDGCPLAWPRGSWASVAPCATFELGRIAGKGTHTDDPASSAHTWMAPGALLRLSILANDFLNLEAEGGGAMPLARYRFYFSPDTPAYNVPPVSWTASVGATLRLP